MPKKKEDPKKENNDDISKVKKEIESVANDYKKYLLQMGIKEKDNKFMDPEIKINKKVKNDKYVYEVPLLDFEEGPLRTIVHSLPDDDLRDKFFDAIENYGIRINVDNGTVELLVYN